MKAFWRLTFAAAIPVLVSGEHNPFDIATYYTDPEWYVNNEEFFPLPTNVTKQTQNAVGQPHSPIAELVMPLGGTLPYNVIANVTQIGVGKAKDNNGPIEDPHLVALTLGLTNQLEFGQTGNMTNNATYTLINSSTAVTGIRAIGYNYDFPQSVLDAWDQEALHSGSKWKIDSCSKALGAACVSALEKRPLDHLGLSGLHIGAPECEDTLGGLAKAVDDSPSSDLVSIVNNVVVNETNVPFLWLSSGAYSGTDDSQVTDALNKMILLGMTVDIVNTSTGAQTQSTYALCFRVGAGSPQGLEGGVERVMPRSTSSVVVAAAVGFAFMWALV